MSLCHQYLVFPKTYSLMLVIEYTGVMLLLKNDLISETIDICILCQIILPNMGPIFGAKYSGTGFNWVRDLQPSTPITPVSPRGVGRILRKGGWREARNAYTIMVRGLGAVGGSVEARRNMFLEWPQVLAVYIKTV